MCFIIVSLNCPFTFLSCVFLCLFPHRHVYICIYIYIIIYVYIGIHRLYLDVCNSCFLIDKYTYIILHIDYMNYMYDVCIYL